MGYYTHYTLSFHHPELGWCDLRHYDADEYRNVHKLKEEYIPKGIQKPLIPFFSRINELGGNYWEGYSEDRHKWHGHSDDMKELSNRFPEMVFELSGEGEESGDIWRKRYRKGKEYYARVVMSYEPWPDEVLVEGETNDT